MLVYLATFVGLAWLGVGNPYWMSLIAVALASVLTITFVDRDWNLGLAARPAVALKDFAGGTLVAVALIAGADVLILLFGGLRHGPGTGFPWRELIVIFIPAVLHEELLFRGYPFQKLYRRWPRFTLVAVALAFAVVHAGNSNVTMLALLNIFLGGLLLGLAYALHLRLWFPIGLHLAWNLMSGPVLGYEVSGYVPAATLLTVVGTGPLWLTGGAFGIEGSALMSLAELGGIAFLMWRMKRGER
ncbi:MAG TPA: CPBP family glutamic-type intramembrane protease [Thermoanaerobaculia bacterium]